MRKTMTTALEGVSGPGQYPGFALKAMAAPEGNQFWKLRSKHGRDKLFESPELLWEAACEYFEWCEKNPFLEVKPMAVSVGNNQGSSVELVEVPVKRPFTMHGLCLYLCCNTDYFKNFKNQERANSEEYSPVIKAIEETVYDQKFSGAAAGFFNANIISRDLGLMEKTEIKHEVSIPILTNDPLSDATSNNSPSEDIGA